MWIAGLIRQDGILENKENKIMKLQGYSSLREFEIEFNIFKSQDNDKQLMEHINNRIQITDEHLIAQILDILYQDLMENEPLKFFSLVMLDKKYKDKTLVINSKEYPWFIV